LLGIPVMLACVFALVVFQSPPERRTIILLLILATTVLTCSSVVGYWFLVMYSGTALSFGATFKGRAIALVLAALAFGISFGSGALLSYLLSRV